MGCVSLTMSHDLRPAADAPATSDPLARERVDALFSALADRRRRLLLGHLHEAGSSVAVDELVDALAADDPADRGRLRLKLYHIDLPKLVDAGFVRFDRETGTVALVDGPDPLRNYLDHAASPD